MSLVMEMHRKLKVLLVEGNADHADLIMDSMVGRDEHFQVTCCESFQDFFRLLENQTFDALLIDYHTGDTDGLEVLEKLKERNVQTPAIFISGTDDDTIISQVLNGGASDFIVKTRSSLKTLPIVVKRSIIRKMASRPPAERPDSGNPFLDLSLHVSQTLDESIRKIRHASQKMALGLSKGKISIADFQEFSGLQDILKKTADALEKTKRLNKKKPAKPSSDIFSSVRGRPLKTVIEK